MKIGSLQPEELGALGPEFIDENSPREPVPARHSVAGPNGYVFQCGRLCLQSVPLEFVFTPCCGSRLNHVVTVNAEIFALAHEDPKLGRILSGTLNTIDGRVLQGLCKLLYPAHRIVRQTGANFIFELAEHCASNSQRLFLLGSSDLANAWAVERLKGIFPGLQVEGFSPPIHPNPFDENWNASILAHIAQFSPHHLAVCFGPPKQEYWIDHNVLRLSELGVRCAYGLGGTIDFVSGLKPRAPRWVELCGAEWLFRLGCEPRQRFRRTLLMLKMPVYAALTSRRIGALDHSLRSEGNSL